MTGPGGIVIESFTDFSSFPTVGNTNQFYLDVSSDTLHFWNGTEYIPVGNGGDCPLDGGFANSVFLVEQCVDGGAA